MKAVILAAGVGSRMGEVTLNCPKCLLQVGGVSVLETQVLSLRENGVEEIHVVVGHLAEQVKRASSSLGLIYWTNQHYASTGMLESLYEARDAMVDDLILCYGDTFLRPSLVAKLVKSDAELALAVDVTASFSGETKEDAFEEVSGVRRRKGSTKIYSDSSGTVRAVSKEYFADSPYRVSEYVGVAFVRHGTTARMRQRIDELIDGGEITEYPSPSYLFQWLLTQDLVISAIEVDSDDYAECDYEADLEQARAKFSNTSGNT